MTLRRALIFAAIAVAALLQASDYIHRPPSWSDLSVDYASAKAALHGQNAYGELRPLIERYVGREGSYWAADQRNPHPPGFVVFVAPLTVLPPRALHVLWLLASLGAVTLAIYLFAREIGIEASSARLLGIAVLAAPIVHEVFSGYQIESFLLLAMVLAWRSVHRGRSTHAGILLGLAAALKIYPLFLLVPLWRRRQRKVVRTALLTGGSLSLAGIVFVGLHPAVEWLTKASPYGVSHWTTSGANVSFAGRLLRAMTGTWTDAPAYAPFIYAAGAAVALFALARTRSVWAAIPWTLLGAPLAWTTYMILVIPLIVLLFRRSVARVPLVLATAVVVAGTRVPFGLDGSLGQAAYAVPTLSLLLLAWISSSKGTGDEIRLPLAPTDEPHRVRR